jgi:hypothetical protein
VGGGLGPSGQLIGVPASHAVPAASTWHGSMDELDSQRKMVGHVARLLVFQQYWRLDHFCSKSV